MTLATYFSHAAERICYKGNPSRDYTAELIPECEICLEVWSEMTPPLKPWMCKDCCKQQSS